MKKKGITALFIAIAIIVSSVPAFAAGTCTGGHTWGDWEPGFPISFINESATGNELTYQRECSTCHAVETYKTTYLESFATCEKAGYKRYTDELHPENNTEETIPPKGHKWGNWSEPVECGSYMDYNYNSIVRYVSTRKCDNCGKEEKEYSETAMAPAVVKRIVPATCTEDGGEYIGHDYLPFEKWQCDEVYPKLGHNWGEWTKKSEETSEDENLNQITTTTYERECSRCHEKEEKTKETVREAVERDEYVQPTCTEGGYIRKSVGGAVSKIDVGAPLGHEFKTWTVVKEATAKAAGTRKSKCERCGEEKTEVIPKLKATLLLSAQTNSVKVGKVIKLTSTVAKGDKVISWKSSNSKIAVVSKDGTVKGMAEGTATITAKSECGASANFAVNVTAPKTKSIKATVNGKTKVALKKKQTAKIKVAKTPKNGSGKIKYSSSNKKVAKVSSKGVITAKAPGTAKITVKCGNLKKIIKVTVQ